MAKRTGPRITPIYLSEMQIGKAASGTLTGFPLLVSRKVIVPEGTVYVTWDVASKVWEFRNSSAEIIGTNPPSLMQCIYGEIGDQLCLMEGFRFFRSSKGNYCITYMTEPQETRYVLSKGKSDALGAAGGVGKPSLKYEAKEGGNIPIRDAKLMDPVLSRFRYRIDYIFLTQLVHYVTTFAGFTDAEEKAAFVKDWEEQHRSDKLRHNPWVWAIKVSSIPFTEDVTSPILREI